MQIGTVVAEPGELARAHLSVTELPTGGVHGDEATGVHGDEATGVAVAQDAVAAEPPGTLAGTIVSVPVVSPAGLRRTARHTYYGDDDPNRAFPDPEAASERPPEVQGRIGRPLYETIAETAAAHVDLHTAQVGSGPFAIRDRVLPPRRAPNGVPGPGALRLTRGTRDRIWPPEVREYLPEEYVEQSLQRSTTTATS